MDEPLVLGAILRIDALGWAGEPPFLPTKPVRAETGEAGSACFLYDLLPGRAGLGLASACERIGVTITRISDEWPFQDLPFPPRCRLDLGLSVPAKGPWLIDWPAPFSAALALEAVELGLSIYPLDSD